MAPATVPVLPRTQGRTAHAAPGTPELDVVARHPRQQCPTVKRVWIFPADYPDHPARIWTCEFADISDDTVFMRGAYRQLSDMESPEAFEEVLYRVSPGETVGVRAME
jgi:hypothetical protein